VWDWSSYVCSSDRRKRAPAGGEVVHLKKTLETRQYVFAALRAQTILALVEWDKANARRKTAASAKAKPAHLRTIYRIWPDFVIERRTSASIGTVKADAAHRSFQAFGAGIVWAVVDSGIDGKHPHFAKHRNLDLDDLSGKVDHADFTVDEAGAPLVDEFGHGTHVAGIIAGEGRQGRTRVATRRREDGGDGEDVHFESYDVAAICGMAPRCKLVSLKVLDKGGRGRVSNVIAALSRIQTLNAHGRRIQVHGVNLSLGYDFDAEWFACGQSPMCVEVDRLVKSGVVVVAAAGNTGYGEPETAARGTVKAPLALSINDPGNAELAITVGSTHRDMPHVYGVSYFSSKGPTGDGRSKPDLVAPGEKIISCAAGRNLDKAREGLGKRPDYVEDSGTSMAAPHVSGVVAAFLSVRREFIGRAEAVKGIFCGAATDLKRERHFQGHGLVDLMRAIQSV
jgi:subtilisin family serine protease